ncbi:MAG TPA: polysaccharide deacetylase family protein [Oceanobacillus sp.]|nr:polysaccharide deacetylase family protein [Oceanobacillus sp.]
MIKQFLSITTRSAVFAKFVSLLEMVEPERTGILRILTYHRVSPVDAHPNLSPALLSATPEGFAEQMRYLAERYHPVSAEDLIAYYEQGKPLPPRAVMVTFDDAYRDFADHAWSVMKHYRIPATLFVPTAYPDKQDRGFWWDRLYQAISETTRTSLETANGTVNLSTPEQRIRAFKTLREYVKTLPHEQAMAWLADTYMRLGVTPPEQSSVLSWEELRKLHRDGVTLGAHTRNHPMMNRITLQEAWTEAVGALDDLERHIGKVLPIFAYPGGGFSDDVVKMLEKEGFALAFTTVRGLNDMRVADRLRLRRLNVGRLAAPASIRAQLLTPWINV